MKEINKRGWVKNATIIFLAALLVLTFFSSTIMNWSLPEVSGQYASYNSITSAIRGSGTVQSNMGYSVQINETRRVKSVFVRNGDRVEAGQPLFELDEAGSQELQAEIEKLENLEYAYNVKILGLTSPDYGESNANIADLKAQIEETTTLLAKVRRDTVDYEDACKVRDALLAEIEKLNEQIADIDEELAEAADYAAEESVLVAQKQKILLNAKKALESAETILANATKARSDYEKGMSSIDAIAKYQELKNTYDAQSDAYNELVLAKREYDAAQADYTGTMTNFLSAKTVRDNAKTAYESKKLAYERAIDSGSYTEEAIANAKNAAENKAIEAETLHVIYERYKASGDPMTPTAKANYDYAAAEAQVLMKKYQDMASARAECISAHSSDLTNVNNAKDAYIDAEEAFARLNTSVNEKLEKLNSLTKVTENDVTKAKAALDLKKAELDKALEAKNTAETQNAKLVTLKKAEAAAENNVETCKTAVENAQKAFDDAMSSYTKGLQTERKTLDSKRKDKNKLLTSAEKTVSELMPERTVKDVENELKSLNKSLQVAVSNLAKQQNADGKADEITQMELKRDREAIEAQRKIVESMQGTGEGTTINARYAGIITQVNCIAGDQVSSGMTLAMIDVEGKGYTLTISVSNQQAQRVKIGDSAKVVDYWWGNLSIILTAIKTDPSSQGKSKLLEFTVQGNVSDGQSLSISIGENQSYYNCVVPTSAIREDKDGKFILTTYAKSTPLGNRYYAKRIDVTVLASDTVNSAIDTNQDYFYEFVIVSSSAPVEDGDMVRMAAGS